MDRLSYMDSSLPNPGAGNRPGAYTFGGDSRGGWRTIANTNWSDFGPRIGFAYNVAKDWVIRSGYGIFYWNVSGTIGVPATGFNTTAAFASGNVGITPAFNWDNGFPQDFQKPPILTPTVQNGQNATAVLRHRGAAWPYNQQWNLTVERQFGRSFAIRTGYVGMKGTRLRSAANLNQVHPSYLSLGSGLNTNITSAQAQAAGLGAPFPGFASLWGTRATVAQALRPFPQYATVGQFNPNDGSSNYHSFQLYAQKQMSQGIDFTASYTFSKVIDDVSTQQNFYDRRADRSIGNFHQPHVVSLSYVYNLPFGPGKRFLNGSSGLAGKIAGGWTLSGLHRYSSGLPLSLSVTNNLPIFNGGLRPNAVAGADQRPAEGPGGFDPARDRYINASAFALPPAFTFGNSARYLDNLLGPAGLSEAFAILKNTGIGERVNLQFRTEISNPFNRVVFGSPATNLSSPNFGQISSQADTPRVIQLGLKLLW
jgi:hypothetical protein